MDKIYLIHEWPTDYYKIGYTRGSVEKRLSTLQTGTPNELRVIAYYESDYAKLIETTFHRFYKPYQINREWFQLSDDVVKDFIQKCRDTERNFKMLEETNFFFQRKKT